jgi:hypothetical protein
MKSFTESEKGCRRSHSEKFLRRKRSRHRYQTLHVIVTREPTKNHAEPRRACSGGDGDVRGEASVEKCHWIKGKSGNTAYIPGEKVTAEGRRSSAWPERGWSSHRAVAHEGRSMIVNGRREP